MRKSAKNVLSLRGACNQATKQSLVRKKNEKKKCLVNKINFVFRKFTLNL